MSILERFQTILNMRPSSLIILIDEYNAGGLSPKTREALEMVEALAND